MSSGYYFHLTAELLEIYVKDAVKSDILTEYLKLFWFAVLINGHKPEEVGSPSRHALHSLYIINFRDARYCSISTRCANMANYL